MASVIIGIVTLLQKIFCNDKSDFNQQQEQQQHGQHQQQQGGYVQSAYPGGVQPSPYTVGGNYPPQQQHHQQQQHGYSQQHHGQQQQHHQQQQQHHGGGGAGSHGPWVGTTPFGPHAPAHQNTDMMNASNTQYVSLRNEARSAGDRAHQLFAQSQAAYQRGDGAEAHRLSEQGKELMAQKDRLDNQAEEWIFRENNKVSPQGTIDLHGLYVKEAIERTEAAIQSAQRSGEDELRIIVGKGNHSVNHVAKIKPAVEDLMRKYNLSAHLEPGNSGVLVVDLQGRTQGGRTRDAGSVVDQLNRDGPDGCTIM